MTSCDLTSCDDADEHDDDDAAAADLWQHHATGISCFVPTTKITRFSNPPVNRALQPSTSEAWQLPKTIDGQRVRYILPETNMDTQQDTYRYIVEKAVESNTLRIHSLKLTAKAPEKFFHWKRKLSYRKPPFLGANMLVSGRVNPTKSWLDFIEMPIRCYDNL